MAIVEEAGVDRAAMLLAAYDAQHDRWDVERSGPFWDAIQQFDDAAQRGAGRTIAVIDGGFDMTVPRLKTQRTMSETSADASTTHGTIVALLALAVAPEAQLLLCPTSRNGSISEESVAAALHDAHAAGADVINVSLEKPYDVGTVFDWAAFDDPASHWPNMDDHDLPFWAAQRLGTNEIRDFVRVPPDSPMASAAVAVASTSIVVAAGGNHSGKVSIPAACPEVFAATFFTEERYETGGSEVVLAGKPSFTTSLLADFALVQPPNVLGSSFASPLIAGLAACMPSLEVLDGFRDMSAFGGLASELTVRQTAYGKLGLPWSDRREAVIGDLYQRALARWPHANETGPCGTCVFFALQTLIDAGLRHLNRGELDQAISLLSRARSLSPTNVHGAANLGVALGALADQASQRNDLATETRLLDQAVAHMGVAVQLRDDYPPYAARLAEFQLALEHPVGWRIIH